MIGMSANASVIVFAWVFVERFWMIGSSVLRLETSTSARSTNVTFGGDHASGGGPSQKATTASLWVRHI